MEVLWFTRLSMTTPAKIPPAQSGYTVAETAYAVDVEDREVNREIDACVLATVGQSSSGERLIDRSGVLYMAAVRDVRTALGKSIRLHIAESLRTGCRTLAIGRFELPVSRLNEIVQPGLDEVDELRRSVTIDSAICGGDPVLNGTRVRVHKVADLIEQGVDRREVEEEFELSPQQVTIALRYARLHPRRGRREIERKDLVEHVPPD
jgi:uncharacterized protein (DUF433 family)